MAEIQKTLDRERNITIFTVSGAFLFDQIMDVTKQFYSSEITLNLIFDLTNADMSSMTADKMEEIVRYSRECAHSREGGKTVFVMSSDLGYGLARMYKAFAEVDNHPVPHHVCRNIGAAMTWIMESEHS